MALVAGPVWAEGITAPLDVTCANPILGASGFALSGNNPSASRYGLQTISGALVQVIDAGPDGQANLPKRDGAISGDDVLFATTFIGQGIAPNVVNSGRFSSSFYPPPPEGSKVYVRIYNAPTVAAATHWGQSNVHTVKTPLVLDASELGLWATTQPKGTNPMSTDSDGDGHSDFQELLANTNADDAGDLLLASAYTEASRVVIAGRAGRSYRLMRSTDSLTGDMTWTPVASTGVLTTHQQLVLSDPAPPDNDHAFYRVEVTNP